MKACKVTINREWKLIFVDVVDKNVRKVAFITELYELLMIS